MSLASLVRAAERRPAQSDLDAIDEAAHALPCHLLDPGQRRLCAGRPGPPPRRPDDGWRAQADRPARRHACGMLGGIRDIEFRQRQRARLVEHDPVDLGQPLDGVAGIEQHAGAEHRARYDGLHRRDRQTERAGTGDDENRNRGDDGIMPGRAEGHPAQHGQERGRMHDRGVEPRRPVGQLHVAGARLHGIVEQPR